MAILDRMMVDGGSIPTSYSTVEDNAAKNAAMSPAARAALEASKASWSADADPYYTVIVGNTGLTQAQIDTRAQAVETAKQINEAYGSLGIKSTVDPATGKITTTSPKGTVLTNNNPPPPATTTTKTTDASLGNPAFDIIQNVLTKYGLKNLGATIAQIRKDYPDISSDNLLALLKVDPRYNASYLERFAGNKILMDKGLPTIDDASYLKAEKEYEKIFAAYDVTGLSTPAYYATLIGNGMDAVDVSKRVAMGYERLKKDENTLNAFKEYFPMLSQGDIVTAMLDPTQQLPALERKVTTAEIGGAALQQGLKTSLATAEDLQAFGVDEATAQKGYSKIAGFLPTAEFLSNITKEEAPVNQATAEASIFKGTASEQRKIQKLADIESARFQGSSGNAPGAFSTGYLKRSSAAGSF